MLVHCIHTQSRKNRRLHPYTQWLLDMKKSSSNFGFFHFSIIAHIYGISAQSLAKLAMRTNRCDEKDERLLGKSSACTYEKLCVLNTAIPKPVSEG